MEGNTSVRFEPAMVESRTFVPAFPANPRAPNGFLYVCKKERAKISSGRGRIGNDSKPGGNAYEQDVRRKRDGGVDPSSRLASSPDRDRLHERPSNNSLLILLTTRDEKRTHTKR